MVSNSLGSLSDQNTPEHAIGKTTIEKWISVTIRRRARRGRLAGLIVAALLHIETV